MRPISRKVLAGVFGAIIMSRFAGFFLSPLLLIQAPVLLLALSPMVLHLGLVSSFIPEYQYYAVGVTVALLHSFSGYFLGRDLGAAAFTWCLENYPAQRRKLNLLSRWVERSSVVSLLLFPGPFLSVLVGSFRMGRRKFFALTLGAQVLWTVMCKFVGTSIYDIVMEIV